MGIVKILVDGEERKFITSLDDDEIELNDNENVNEDTIVLEGLISEVKKINESSELNG